MLTGSHFNIEVLGLKIVTDGRYATYAPDHLDLVNISDPENPIEVELSTDFVYIDTGYDETVTERPDFVSIAPEGE